MNVSFINMLYVSCFTLLTTVHRQPGRDAAEQPSGDSGCDETDTSEWNPLQVCLLGHNLAPLDMLLDMLDCIDTQISEKATFFLFF